MSGRVLAIDNSSMSIRAQVVMGALVVVLLGIDEVKSGSFIRKTMLQANIEQIGPVIDRPRYAGERRVRWAWLIVLPAGITGRPARMRPAEVDVVSGRQLLGNGQP